METKSLKSNKEKTREMTILAMFIAIVLVMTFVPYVGYIQIPGIPAFILIHIPVLIGGAILGRKAAVILALTFGIGSLIKATYSPGLDYLFIFPWVSVLPRFIWGLMIYDVVRLFRKLIKPRLLAFSVSFIILTVIHTLLVVPLLFTAFPLAFNVDIADNVGAGSLDWITAHNSLSGLFLTLGSIFTTNGIIEAALAGTIGAIVADRVLTAREKTSEDASI